MNFKTYFKTNAIFDVLPTVEFQTKRMQCHPQDRHANHGDQAEHGVHRIINSEP